MNILTPFIDRFVLRRVRPNALAVLGERFGGIIAHQIVWWTEGDFEEITSRSIRHHAAGTRLILSFAAMSAAMYRTLVASNIAPAEAQHLVAEIGRRTYAPLWRIPWRLARLFAFGHEARLAMTVRLFRFFPFGNEDYDMRERSFGDGRVCLDILRCPTVALYEDLGIPHLCRALVCDLDFGLAKEWHATLQRPQTLAEGDYQCDFRWTPASPEGAP